MALTLNDWSQVAHLARLEVLAMCARGVAQHEGVQHDELSRVVVTVTNPRHAVPDVEIEFFGSHSVPLGGVSL